MFVVTDEEARTAVVTLLEFIGEDPTRAGLVETPRRVTAALKEMTSGYAISDEESLATLFDEQHDEMVVLGGIAFTSLCEHHLLPFAGEAVVGYVPQNRIVGLSKLARCVYQYAARLQNQERMTAAIADAVMSVVEPFGVGVVVRAHHGCMSCRGVRQNGSQMTTSALRGAMRDDAVQRGEFLSLAFGHVGKH
jgi:GTP cyclohydrolase I